MKEDINNRAAIEQLIHCFYTKAIQDPLIGHFFIKVVQLDWEAHIPVICDFWETVLLDKIVYKGNPIVKHIDLDRKATLQQVHFERWVELFEETVNELFEGEKAEEAKKRAQLMSQLMFYKVEKSRDAKFIQ
ncbi:group III truncated hemoglobin [Rapidithrix thailandica]|uniref:Group III truncated hemoglobin n=1 Tax=Rapidithrix thailandica TaxID=413964 RepID=A0AAW9SA56_9BACT